MLKVYIRFYEELNFFIPPEKHKKLIEENCKEGTTSLSIWGTIFSCIIWFFDRAGSFAWIYC